MRIKKTKTIAEIKQAGFKRIGKTEYFINIAGIVYNRQTDRTSRPKYIHAESGNISRKKAILQAYSNQPPRLNKTIKHLDGNKNNLNPDNLRYISITDGKQTEIDIKALYEAIRKYFCVDTRFKADIRQFETRLYLSMIAEKHNFSSEWKKDVFKTMFKEHLTNIETLKTTSTKYNLTIRDTRNIIYSRLNRLTKEINTQNKIMLPTTTRKTEKQRMKKALTEWNQLINQIENGF